MKKDSLGFIDFMYIIFFPISLLYSTSVSIFFEKGSFIGLIVNVSWFAFLVYACFFYYRVIPKFISIYLFLSLLLLLIFFNSSSLEISLRIYCKCAIGILCLPLSYSIFSNSFKIREFLKINILLLLLIFVYLIVANVFKWHTSYGYRNENMFSTGNIYSDTLYLIVYILMGLPLILSFYPKKKWWIYLLSIFCFVFLIIFMKRTVILMIILGIMIIYGIVNYYLSRYKSFYRSTIFARKYVFLFLTLILCIMPFFKDTIESQLARREQAFVTEHFKEEGRVKEWEAVCDEILYEGNIVLLLLGKEPFNSVGNYGHGKFGPRQIHSDYSALLHGTGIIGIFFYFSIHVYLLVLLIRLKCGIPLLFFRRDPVSVYLFAISVSLLLLRFISASSGNIDAVLSNALFYTYIGITLRFLSNYRKKIVRLKNSV